MASSRLLVAPIIHPVLAWFEVFLVPFVGIEYWLAKRSRPTTRIPDHRPSDTVDVPLDRR